MVGGADAARVRMGKPMTAPDQEWWTRARQARDELVNQFLIYPDVILIDIGQDPLGVSPTPVFRVHVRPHGTTNLQIPEVIDDIPVRVIPGDYRLQ